LRISNPGLNFKFPVVDTIKNITLQNLSGELSFQAITKDQANVHFKALIIYSVKDATEETIKKVAFTFATIDQFNQALTKTIEGMVRSFIAGKGQQEVLGLRKEIIEYVQEHIAHQLENWGYSLHDIQVNDISFDKVITDSMAQVVASANLKAAATNEGEALMIKKTKAAEAEGKSILILAESEKQAEILRGQGVAGFREEIAKGMKVSLDSVGDDKGTDIAVNLISLSMWMETLKNIAENGKGNFISFDGSNDGLKKFFQPNVLAEKAYEKKS
jgi:regulator of protease activity HflC (stomatin/prohibitin superfamily)